MESVVLAEKPKRPLASRCSVVRSNRPGASCVAGFDSSTSYHDYRIDWTADRVVFTASSDTGTPITLWDYQGPSSRIPQQPSQYLVNLWHTDDWTPDGRPSATQAPDSALAAFVDSSTVTAQS